MPPKMLLPLTVNRPMFALIPVLACLLMATLLFASSVAASDDGGDGTDDMDDPDSSNDIRGSSRLV